MSGARTRHSYAGRSVAERRAERRALFIDAGLTVFAQRSYAASSIADVCAVAGLSRRQFYEQYSAREELLVDVYDHVQQRARAAFADGLAAAGSGDARTLMDAALRAYVGAITADNRWVQVAFVEIVGVGPEVERHRERVRTGWGEVIAAAAAAVPGVRTPTGGWELAMSAFIGAVNGAVHHWSRQQPRPSADDLLAVLSALLAALILPASGAD
ncbi:TetR/AcrR family transcriptional regulator [Nocardia sp. NPDC024068]|uniref:TetR/AcrR family transcriptional regulator n=1 Tax=Nocardia sp. NPDC024068 TaxID=3157197 RepID=UPI0033FD0B1D